MYCLTGRAGAGKSVACDVARGLGHPVVSMGDIVRWRARESLGDAATSAEILAWADEQRLAHGQGIIAEYTADRIEERYDASDVVVDGLRTMDELAVFERRFGDVTLVLVMAPFEERLARLRSRGRDGEDAFTAEDLRERDRQEEAWGLGELIDQSAPDVVIANDGSIEEFESAVKSVLTSR